MNWRNNSNLEDALNIAVSDGATTSAASLRSLPGILSCPADLEVLIVESYLYTLVKETFCIVNWVSGLVTYDSGVLELCGMFLTKRNATSLKCEFKASAISCFLVKFRLSFRISDIWVVFDCLFVSLLIAFHIFFGLLSQSFN